VCRIVGQRDASQLAEGGVESELLVAADRLAAEEAQAKKN
jgi:hypothetical protein